MKGWGFAFLEAFLLVVMCLLLYHVKLELGTDGLLMCAVGMEVLVFWVLVGMKGKMK